jgi:lipopolysaccharide export LptBFGC system permease protein LptF
VTLLDRHIVVRYLSNFVLLFGLLFVFAVSIDVVIQFDSFADAAKERAGRTSTSYPLVLAHAILDFHAPRIFQFFAFMTGLVGIGAAGFTVVQMHRTRELVAIMAAGVPLQRVATAILAAQLGVVLLQLVDQELVLPRIAARLVRDHDAILESGVETFEAPLMRDSAGDLLYAREVDPRAGVLTSVLILERDDDGTSVARVTAARAEWDDAVAGWRLEDGVRMETDSGRSRPADRTSVTLWETDLSPRMLQARRNLNFAQMLSLGQLRDLRDAGGASDGRVERTMFGRFSGALVNLLVPVIAMPFFLARNPGVAMLSRSLQAALVSIPLLVGALAAMTVAIPGLPAGVGAFLPVALLLPIAIARMAYLET